MFPCSQFPWVIGIITSCIEYRLLYFKLNFFQLSFSYSLNRLGPQYFSLWEYNWIITVTVVVFQSRVQLLATVYLKTIKLLLTCSNCNSLI